jgi:hypothetical protein
MKVEARDFVLARFVSDCAGLAHDLGLTAIEDLHDASCAVLAIGLVVAANPGIPADMLETMCASEVVRQRTLRELRTAAAIAYEGEQLCQI